MSSTGSNNPKVKVFVGTRKGGFIFTSDRNRRVWQISDLHFKSWNVMHMQLDPRDLRLHTAIVHDVYGPSTHYSDDFGQTWVQARQLPVFPRLSNYVFSAWGSVKCDCLIRIDHGWNTLSFIGDVTTQIVNETFILGKALDPELPISTNGWKFGI